MYSDQLVIYYSLHILLPHTIIPPLLHTHILSSTSYLTSTNMSASIILSQYYQSAKTAVLSDLVSPTMTNNPLNCELWNLIFQQTCSWLQPTNLQELLEYPYEDNTERALMAVRLNIIEFFDPQHHPVDFPWEDELSNSEPVNTFEEHILMFFSHGFAEAYGADFMDLLIESNNSAVDDSRNCALLLLRPSQHKRIHNQYEIAQFLMYAIIYDTDLELIPLLPKIFGENVMLEEFARLAIIALIANRKKYLDAFVELLPIHPTAKARIINTDVDNFRTRQQLTVFVDESYDIIIGCTEVDTSGIIGWLEHYVCTHGSIPLDTIKAEWHQEYRQYIVEHLQLPLSMDNYDSIM